MATRPQTQNSTKDNNHAPRVGDWLPSDHRQHRAWLGQVIEEAERSSSATEFHPVLKEFAHLMAKDSRCRMLFTSMFQEIPHRQRYNCDPVGTKQIRDADHMLQLLNHLLTQAPSWSDPAHDVGMVGLPINAILDWPMGTPSGYAAFLDPAINGLFKKILDAWGEYLSSPASAEQVLHSSQGGWFSPDGKAALEKVANMAAGQSFKFEEQFQCDHSKPSYGFESWDGFFTRLFREGVRPVASPGNDLVIANACESEPFKIAHNIKLQDEFWNKGQPYSAAEMLAHHPLSQHFEGGSVYQAFLSALSYHRWHSPVSGKIRSAFVQPGTYYSEPLFETLALPDKMVEGKDDINEAGEAVSQAYLSQMATRAIIFIEAESDEIGLMAFIGIGMSEVSSCDITVKEGQSVQKGDQLGMFHFGGSTHCLVFRPGVELDQLPKVGRGKNVPVRGQLAIVKRSQGSRV